MRVFLIAFNVESDIRRLQVIARVKEFGSWMSYIPNCWLVKTNLTSAAMQTDLLTRIAPTDRLLIVEVNPNNHGGWLPQEGWNWIRNS